MITDAQLKQIMPRLTDAGRAQYLPHLNAAMGSHGVDTPLRTAAFVAQLAHESGEFRWMEEIWGPTAAQLRYEPPSPLAARLGNTQPGDGKRFKGRGPIQITGRFNYQKFGELLALDLVGDPAIAAKPEIAFATAALFWRSNGLNELADVRDFVAITRRINGGTNGLAERQRYYARALAVLGAEVPAQRGAPLQRGFEAIVAAASRPAKRAATKKAAVKKAPGTPPSAKAPAAKKAAAKKAVAKKAVAKKAGAIKANAKPARAKKAPARRSAR
jgi:predicted chitinase